MSRIGALHMAGGGHVDAVGAALRDRASSLGPGRRASNAPLDGRGLRADLSSGAETTTGVTVSELEWRVAQLEKTRPFKG